MNTKIYSKVILWGSILLLGAVFLLYTSPPLYSRDFQVLYDLRVDGNVNTPYGGIGRYQNLLTYSDAFDNSAWVKTNVSTVTADQITAPDGSTTGEALSPATAAATNVKNTSGTAAITSTSYTFSLWAKTASGTKDIVLTVGDTATNNTATASLTTTWQRFSVTYTSSVSPTGNVFAQVGNASWTADTIHVWGGQLEQASSMGVYVKTTSSAVTASRGLVSNGDVNFTGNLYQGGSPYISSQWTTSGSNIYYNTGNVGIGSTAPSQKLDVVGSGTISGNLGIGTTTPSQKLHVEGQCVTGDTLLPVIRDAAWSVELGAWSLELGGWRLELGGWDKRGDNEISVRESDSVAAVKGICQENIRDNQSISEGRAIWSYKPAQAGSCVSAGEYSRRQGEVSQKGIYPVSLFNQITFPPSSKLQAPSLRYIPITDVKPGDYVLSLNEKTGQIEPARINGLLDMGVKPVFKLTTASGRFIKTTGNHPYLTKDGWKKVIELGKGDKIAVPKVDVFKQINAYEADVSCDIALSEIAQIKFQNRLVKLMLQLSPCYSSPFGGGQIAKPKSKSATNDIPMVNLTNKVKLVKNPLTNAATVVSLKISNTACDNAFLLSLWNSISKAYHIIDNLSSKAYAVAEITPFEVQGARCDVPGVFNRAPSTRHPAQDSDILWDRIISIEYIGEEHVYDIEVEGTHNFMAGHFVKKTDVAGKLESWKAGEDNFQPSSNVQLSSQKFFFGGIIAHNTYISSNVGIGSTAPSQKLDVVGSGTISGNLGIGTTTPSSKLNITTAGLGTTQTTSSGLALVNTTAAALGAQQISPAVRWSGFGWKTNATAASQAVDFRSYAVPVQGAVNPTGYLTFESSVNGGAYGSSVNITTGGRVGIGTTAPDSSLQIHDGSIELSSSGGSVTMATNKSRLYEDTFGLQLTGSSDIKIADGNGVQKIEIYNGGNIIMQANGGNVGIGNVTPTEKLYVTGNIYKTGTVNFVAPHPTDPTKEIIYVCLEGGEAGTYVRGHAQLAGGEADITLSEHFSLVTSPEQGITAQITPIDDCNGLRVVKISNSELVVKELNNGKSSARFYYTVNGVRNGYEGYQPIKNK